METKTETKTEARIDLMATRVGAEFGKRFYRTGAALTGLPPALSQLVELRASQINGCGWCVDVHSKEAAAAGESAVRLALVAAWRESAVFTAAERAALALAEEGTRLADAAQGVSDATWAAVREHYDEEQTAALVCLVSMINAANRMGVITRMRGGSYTPGVFAALED
jgi:AhpD family alkylhydroperoxidase